MTCSSAWGKCIIDTRSQNHNPLFHFHYVQNSHVDPTLTLMAPNDDANIHLIHNHACTQATFKKN
jgi:hypothetical protein